MSKMAVVFDSTQIKSSVNNIGTFDRGEGSISYSLPDRQYTETENAYTVSEIKKLNNTISNLKEMLKLQRTETHGTVMQKASVDRAAEALMDKYNLTKGKGKLADLLNEAYVEIAQKTNSKELTWEEVEQAATPIVW